MSDWPDELDLHVESMAQGGDGVGRWEGRAVFAKGGLPGEEVRVRLQNRQRSFARGQVVDARKDSPARVVSPCPFEVTCGAADWRWIDYQAQLEFKATILRDQLRHMGGIEVEVAAVHGMLPEDTTALPDGEHSAGWRYRTTAELHVADEKIGYYAPESRHVGHLPRCCLHHPLIDEALATLHPPLRAGHALQSVTIRYSPAMGAVLATLHGGSELEELARDWMAACPKLSGVLQRRGGRYHVLAGEDHLVQELHGIRWHVGAGSFFQVNHAQTGRLIERVCELFSPEPGQRMLDLFCGVGTFALPLAQKGAAVTGVESYAPAIDDARRSAALNGISNVSWHAGAVEAILGRLRGAFAGAVLDPPRRGCEPAALRHLLRLQPRRIVYVACHPGTLARDCKLLVEGGYKVKQAEKIDLFPQTHHVESIVLLERG